MGYSGVVSTPQTTAEYDLSSSAMSDGVESLQGLWEGSVDTGWLANGRRLIMQRGLASLSGEPKRKRRGQTDLLSGGQAWRQHAQI